MFDPNRSIRAEEDRLVSCTSKHPYPSAQAAWRVVERTQRRKGADGRLRPYRCRFTNHWHIGNAITP